MHFELKAITQDGRVESLDFQALDEAGARQQAESRGYTVLALRRKPALSGARRSGATSRTRTSWRGSASGC